MNKKIFRFAISVFVLTLSSKSLYSWATEDTEDLLEIEKLLFEEQRSNDDSLGEQPFNDFASVSASTPLPVYIGGVRYQFTSSDFSRTGNTLTAKIPVIGDVGQPLLFDIDASVSGEASYDLGFGCHKLYPQPNGTVRIGVGIPPDCHFATVDPSNQIQFVAQLKVFCSGIPIGNHLDNKNTLLPDSVVEYIRQQAMSYINQEIYILPDLFPSSYDRHRNLSLLVDSNQSMGGQCQELTIELVQLENTYISNILLDIIIAEQF